ncbi:MAG TPA: DUF4230 domain-containing protein [Micromonosporaceae bacterium]
MSGKSAGGEPAQDLSESARGPVMVPPGAGDDSPWRRDAGPSDRPDDPRPGAGASSRPEDWSPDLEPPAGVDRGRPARSLVVLAGVVALIVVLALGFRAVGLWPEFRNPFGQQQTDRSQPALLKSIQDLSRYVAAEGTFQKVVDLQTSRQNVPTWLVNDRTLFVAAGRVEAYVDFGKIGEGAITESADGKSVQVKLPAPQLGEANLDLENSYVFAEQRGLLNRLSDLFASDPDRQRQVYQLAEEQITAAARESGLAERAQENTRKMLEGLLKSLGYQTVTVTFETP